MLQYVTGFPAFYEKEIPWVFPDISLRTFQNSMRNTFSLRCYIQKSHYNQSVNELGHMAQDAHTPNWRKPFPSGSLSQIPWVVPDLWCFSQIPWVFPDWKIGNSFSRFPWFPEWLGILGKASFGIYNEWMQAMKDTVGIIDKCMFTGANPRRDHTP